MQKEKVCRDHRPASLLVYKIPYRRARARPSASREQRYLAYNAKSFIINSSLISKNFFMTAVGFISVLLRLLGLIKKGIIIILILCID